MRKVDLASHFVFFKHREINNPDKTEHAFIDQILILTNFDPRTTSQACRRIRIGTGKKHRITIFGTHLRTYLFSLLGT